MQNNLNVPIEVIKTCEVLRDSGFKAYLIGGCTRDLILGREPKDWDITTNASPAQIQSLYPETFYENVYGTVGVVTDSSDSRLRVVEITPFRSEGLYSNARHPDTICFVETLQEDLKRRDFTMNAIAYDPISHETVDEHGGIADIKRGVINTVGNPDNRFSEDALRMLRGIRLASELGFAMEGSVMASVELHAKLLVNISRERIRDEFVRMLLSDRPMQAIFIAQKLGVIKYIMPELEEAIGVEQNSAHSYDVYEHLLRSLQHAADKHWSLEVRLSALLHDIGKPRSRRKSEETQEWTFYGHEVIGARMVKDILNKLKFSHETITIVTRLVRWHMFFSDPDKITLSAVRRMIINVDKEHINDLINVRICDRIGTGRPKEQPFRLRKYMSMIDEALRDPISVKMLALDGNKLKELGVETGPRMGWILNALLEEVLDEAKKNTVEYLVSRVTELNMLSMADLKILGEAGKLRKEEEDMYAVSKLRERHHVA